jgi:NADPH-dependent 2,4-dienoyl-CoA reductase/sulfur reductase-like enzyme
MASHLIVIGGVAAGMSAAAKARRTDRDLEIIVYERGAFISYAACGMPYWLAGDLASHDKLIVRSPEQMRKQGIQVHIHHEVTAIDPEARTVTVSDLENENRFTQTYDKLVIGTGARPTWPAQGPTGLAGVLGLRSLESGLALQRFLQEKTPHSAVLVGGGYIAIEMAETFRRLGLDVTMVIRSGQVLRSTIDDDMRKLVEAELERYGVRVVTGTLNAVEGDEQVEAIVSSEERIPCDLALMGMGARPNVELAKAAGVTLGPTGAIATDAYMRTNLPDVYAAGDCCEELNLVTGKPAYIPLGSTANKQGRVAGENVAGGQARFGSVVGTMVVRCFNLVVASTGLTSARARAAGFQVQETMVRAKDISHYFPGAADIHVKLVVDASRDRLLGGQIIGFRGVAKRIDVLATALYNRMTISELRQLDLSYAPPFAPVWDPILVAANVAAKE